MLTTIRHFERKDSQEYHQVLWNEATNRLVEKVIQSYLHVLDLPQCLNIYKNDFCFIYFTPMGSTLRSPALKQNFMIFVSNIFYTHGKYAEVTYSYTKLPQGEPCLFIICPDYLWHKRHCFLVFRLTSHSFTALSREISSWTLEERYYIYARPCFYYLCFVRS